MNINAVNPQLPQSAGKVGAGQTGRLTSAEDAKLKQVCKDMESVFINMLLKEMRASVPQSELMGNRTTENMIRSMLDEELSKNMASAGGIGLADMLYRQLNKTYNNLPAGSAKSQTVK